MAEQLKWMFMSMLKCAFRPCSKPFANYVIEIILPSTKNTVTELLIIRVCQLILSSHITTYWIIGERHSLWIIKLGPAEAQERVKSVRKKSQNSTLNSSFDTLSKWHDLNISRYEKQHICKYARYAWSYPWTGFEPIKSGCGFVSSSIHNYVASTSQPRSGFST